MKVTIEVRDQGVVAGLDRLAKLGSDLRPVLSDIGAAVAESTRLRFRESRAPSGAQWAPLSPVTIALRRRGKTGGGSPKPLLDTGRLVSSITYRASGKDVVIGTNVVYAPTQHFGAKEGVFGRYSQVGRVRKHGSGTFKGSAGTKSGFPIPWGNIPARPFLGLSAADHTEIAAILRSHIQGVKG